MIINWIWRSRTFKSLHLRGFSHNLDLLFFLMIFSRPISVTGQLRSGQNFEISGLSIGEYRLISLRLDRINPAVIFFSRIFETGVATNQVFVLPPLIPVRKIEYSSLSHRALSQRLLFHHVYDTNPTQHGDTPDFFLPIHK